MMQRRGEKAGWLLGWLGGFIWVAIVAAILLTRGRLLQGLLGLALASAAVAVVFMSAPWKHPQTQYWKLMLPVYVVFFASVGWAVYCYDEFQPQGFSPWALFLLLPLLSPFATVGKRTWDDSDAGKS